MVPWMHIQAQNPLQQHAHHLKVSLHPESSEPHPRSSGRAEHREPAEDKETKGKGSLQENHSIKRWLHLPLTDLFALHHAGELWATHIRKLLLLNGRKGNPKCSELSTVSRQGKKKDPANLPHPYKLVFSITHGFVQKGIYCTLLSLKVSWLNK